MGLTLQRLRMVGSGMLCSCKLGCAHPPPHRLPAPCRPWLRMRRYGDGKRCLSGTYNKMVSWSALQRSACATRLPRAAQGNGTCLQWHLLAPPPQAVVREVPSGAAEPQRLYHAHLGGWVGGWRAWQPESHGPQAAPGRCWPAALCLESGGWVAGGVRNSILPACLLSAQFGTAPLCAGECNVGDRVMARAQSKEDVPADQGRWPLARARSGSRLVRACRRAMHHIACEAARPGCPVPSACRPGRLWQAVLQVFWLESPVSERIIRPAKGQPAVMRLVTGDCTCQMHWCLARALWAWHPAGTLNPRPWRILVFFLPLRTPHG